MSHNLVYMHFHALLTLHHTRLLSNPLARGTALDTSSSWAVKMGRIDPLLIISLLRHILVGHGWSISTDNAELLIDWDGLLGASEGTTSALTTLTAALGLWEESLDPGLVDVVEGSGTDTGEHEVEEEAGWMLARSMESNG